MENKKSSFGAAEATIVARIGHLDVRKFPLKEGQTEQDVKITAAVYVNRKNYAGDIVSDRYTVVLRNGLAKAMEDVLSIGRKVLAFCSIENRTYEDQIETTLSATTPGGKKVSIKGTVPVTRYVTDYVVTGRFCLLDNQFTNAGGESAVAEGQIEGDIEDIGSETELVASDDASAASLQPAW